MTAGEAVDSKAPQVAFLFTGHGSHCAWCGPGRLRNSATIQRRAWMYVTRFLRPLLGQTFIPALCPNGGRLSVSYWPMRLTRTLGLMFALEYALAELWRSWG